MWQPIGLPYQVLPGFSRELLADHYTLYQGYLDRYNKNEKLLEAALRTQETWMAQRLVQEQTFLRNAGRLHELYFENLAPGGRGHPKDVIGPVYGKWMAKMMTLGLGSTGWVILALDLKGGKPFVYSMKEHGQGYVEGAFPLIVLDCYEHAYMTDYRLRKGAYIAVFFKNVDWLTVGKRLKAALKVSALLK